jgi:hypothetical protein
MAQRDTREVEHRKSAFAGRQTRAASAHLLIQDRAVGESRHDEIADLLTVKASVQHVYADDDLRIFLFLETLDLRGGVHSIVRPEP